MIHIVINYICDKLLFQTNITHMRSCIFVDVLQHMRSGDILILPYSTEYKTLITTLCRNNIEMLVNFKGQVCLIHSSIISP